MNGFQLHDSVTSQTNFQYSEILDFETIPNLRPASHNLRIARKLVGFYCISNFFRRILMTLINFKPFSGNPKPHKFYSTQTKPFVIYEEILMLQLKLRTEMSII